MNPVAIHVVVKITDGQNMSSFFKKLFGFKQDVNVVEATYHVIMDQSRNSALYVDLAIPDTMNGRFESLTLHMFFVLNRLRGNGAICEEFAQELIDYLVVNLDEALREEGVSDNKVAKRIKSMLTLFYGRIKAYDSAVSRMDAQNSDVELIDFFERTIFEKNNDSSQNAKQLELYFQKAVAHIQNKDINLLLNCQLRSDEYHALLSKKKA